MELLHILAYIGAINIITFFLYGMDKQFSRKGMFRISEKTLLIFALIGGSPAAYLGQKIFRHKTSKTSFRTRFWLIVLIQIAAAIYYFNFYR